MGVPHDEVSCGAFMPLPPVFVKVEFANFIVLPL
jgi:hypothetical protein